MNALSPLSWAYGAGVSIHRRARIVGKPAFEHPRIISIGNLEAGGNGKTPLAMWMLARAAHQGESVAYVSRGYGGDTTRSAVTCVLAADAAPGSLAGLRVMSRSHEDLARAVGDEGALVCERVSSASAFFSTDKVRAVEAAVSLGAELVVLDDAFQSWRVARHTDIVLLDPERPLDGGALLPAGRLREKPDALRRADAIVFNGAATPDALDRAREVVARWLRPDIVVAGMGRRIELVPARGERVQHPDSLLAVSGIAKPDAFVRTLKAAGVNVTGHIVFRDHHRYDSGDVTRIVERARREQASIVTTEKDWMKLRRFGVEAEVWIARLDVTLVGDELPG